MWTSCFSLCPPWFNFFVVVDIFMEKKWKLEQCFVNFARMKSFTINEKIWDFASPMVMGILNLTPDSFFDGGKFLSEEKFMNHVAKMIEDGATIMDIGGQSTKPNAEMILVEEELNRVISPIEKIRKHFPEIIISIDTFRSEVAKRAVEAGANFINDISAGSLDEKMFDTVSSLKVPYVLMHMQGTPQTMQKNPHYENVFDEVFNFFKQKIAELNKKGIHDIILDPGFGFGKTVEHNFTLLKRLNEFHFFELPILVGLSRKSLINKVLHTKPDDALNGTTSLQTIALQNGANILRVHDVKEAMQIIQLTNQYHHAAL